MGFVEMAMLTCLPTHSVRHKFEDEDTKDSIQGKTAPQMNRFPMTAEAQGSRRSRQMISASLCQGKFKLL